MNKHIINERIKNKELRVIDETENLGIITKSEALQIARSKELDLVIIAESANPPVAKIMDYSKFLYEEKKKKSAAKAKSKKTEIKELRLSASIGLGDLTKRAERAKDFIKQGNRVKVSLMLRGRQQAHPEVAMEKINTFESLIQDVAKTDSKPKLNGRTITAIFSGK